MTASLTRAPLFTWIVASDWTDAPFTTPPLWTIRLPPLLTMASMAVPPELTKRVEVTTKPETVCPEKTFDVICAQLRR